MKNLIRVKGDIRISRTDVNMLLEPVETSDFKTIEEWQSRLERLKMPFLTVAFQRKKHPRSKKYTTMFTIFVDRERDYIFRSLDV